jgi:hypothetical protein
MIFVQILPIFITAHVSYGIAFLKLHWNCSCCTILPVILVKNVEQQRCLTTKPCKKSADENSRGCTSVNRLLSYKTGHINSVHQHATRFLRTKQIFNVGTTVSE